MTHFKSGDFVILDNNIYYVSKVLDNDGDFILLTNSYIKNKTTKMYNWNEYNVLNSDIINKLEKEMLSLNYEYFRIPTRRIYPKIKISIKHKLKNILSR